MDMDGNNTATHIAPPLGWLLHWNITATIGWFAVKLWSHGLHILCNTLGYDQMPANLMSFQSASSVISAN